MSCKRPFAVGTDSRPTRLALTICCLLCAFGPVAAGALEIYRCESPEGTEFSDVPCSESAEIHRPRNGISVVHAADGLESISDQNRAFIEGRRSRIAERRARADNLREQAERNQRAAAARSGRDQRAVIWSPGWASPAVLDRSGSRAPDPRIRARQRRETDETPRDRRRSLLQRSGGGGTILAPRPTRYQ